MKRPNLVHFLAIKTDDYVAIRASCTMKEWQSPIPTELAQMAPKFPIQEFRLLKSSQFQMKIVCFDNEHNVIFKKTYDSDSFGNFSFKIPMTEQRKNIKVIQTYETKKKKGLELHMGTFMPLTIPSEDKKLIICDFDKTLVDTKYSNTKEVYNSLTKPISSFPTVENSVAILTSHIEKGFHPFILSASPHFYEEAMRDWLYQNKIYTAGIFLKDYRHIFSLLEGELTTKDLKTQGLYKLNHLLDILTMTGIPDELVLMGDNFESDPVIYLTLAKVLSKEIDPWKMWSQLKKEEAFQFNRKQNSKVLAKFYQLGSMINNRAHKCNVKIYIRKKTDESEINLKTQIPFPTNTIELYEGRTQLLPMPEERPEQ
ncbi:phosphatase domain-containing protein [Halobacteriovorax sp. HLS]|uniref:phosphatase domain-containing protein n=1 Tax=Halobacteriovorax sp. HLS TaxID=2234000 RepID=UPI000FDC595A|nr:phosphatase domain-containing protein [Halobacteriovorax sp. HLS]